MEFRVLGPISHRTTTGWHTPTGRLQRTLLAMLLTRPGNLVTADELIDVLWGPATDKEAWGRLQVHVHRLRQALGEGGRVENRSGGYTLWAAPEDVDALQFEELTSRALTPDVDPASVVDLADRALGLWHGRPYDGVDSPLCEAAASRLEQRRLALLEAKFEAALRLGRHGEVLDDLDRAARAHPLHEGLQELLMTAQDRTGRRTEALSTFRRVRADLVEELGVEPGTSLQRLHEQVLLGESPETDSATRPPVPRQLPPAPRMLAGREDALAVLDKVMDTASPAVVVLTGAPGVGKTALALAWAHQHAERYPDGHLHCDLRGFGGDRPLDPADVLDSFVRALGGTAASSSLEEKQALHRSHMAGRRMLLVLDNAGDEDQVRPLLPAAPGCDVLVTSRVSLDGLAVHEDAHLVGLAPLPPDLAEQLMAGALGDRLREEPDAARALVGRCAGLPLALRIVAQRLRARPAMSISSFVREIEEAAMPLDRFDLGGRTTSVRAVMGWSYDSLSPEARSVMRALGLFPGLGADVCALTAMTGLPPETTRAALDLLVRSSLADPHGEDTFRQHDLLRTFSAERAMTEDAPEERTRMLERLLEHYVAGAVRLDRLTDDTEHSRPAHADRTADRVEGPWITTAEEGRAWFTAHLPNLVACAAAHDALAEPTTEGDLLVSDLAQSCSQQLLSTGATAVAVPLLQAWRNATRRAGDEREEARAEIVRATAMHDSGDNIGGERVARDAIDLAMSHGHEGVAARGMLNLGVVIFSAGRAQEAHDLYRRALEIDVRLGEHGHARLVRANLATALVLLGRHTEAIETATLVVTESEQAGDTYNVCFGTQVIGESLLREGDTAGALDHALRARETALSIGALARAADVTNLVGEIKLAEGDPRSALAEFHAGLRQSREIQTPPLTLQLLVGCANALDALGSPEAESYLHEARAVALATGDLASERELARRLADQGVDTLV